MDDICILHCEIPRFYYSNILSFLLTLFNDSIFTILERKQSMKYLITDGAAGIVSHLCDVLQEEENDVCCFNNLSLGTKKNILYLESYPGGTFIEAKSLDQKVLHKLCDEQQFDGAFHMTVNSGIQAGSENQNIDIENTLLTTTACLDGVERFNIHEFILSFSSAVYRENDPPLKEDSGVLRHWLELDYQEKTV
ncbi:hypothetical protein DID78_05130 [Candidatus Marinamargulisbacteria bacterium SCGC AG-343-D04]|nr:hypothetical protein DID78_05130 [Candidatus Marinamargulisbacteria bacterium SCGC AG-343-D04]